MTGNLHRRYRKRKGLPDDGKPFCMSARHAAQGHQGGEQRHEQAMTFALTFCTYICTMSRKGSDSWLNSINIHSMSEALNELTAMPEKLGKQRGGASAPALWTDR